VWSLNRSASTLDTVTSGVSPGERRDGRNLDKQRRKVEMKKAALIVVGTLLVVACGRNYTPSSPSQVSENGSASSSSSAADGVTALTTPLVAQAQGHVGFGFNGVVSGFPTGKVFLTGGGTYERDSRFVHAGGGFTCINAVQQGPLSMSINQNDPGPCLDNQGIRWDTAELLESTPFKCTGSAGGETAVTTDTTVVLKADFYRAGNGDDESFTGKMIVSSHDISSNFPGMNLWVEGVGCGVAQAVNFSR
jgi:hypothetical protein